MAMSPKPEGLFCWMLNRLPSGHRPWGQTRPCATRVPSWEISTVRWATWNSRRSWIAVCRQSASDQLERRQAARFGDADRLAALQTDRQVQPGQRHELRLDGGMELLTGLGPEHLGPEDGLAFDGPLALQLPGVSQFFLGAAGGVLGRRRKAWAFRTS